jgi:hypothetical protein
MRVALLLVILLLPMMVFGASAVDPKAQPIATPLMRVVEPSSAKVGVEVVVTGDNLGKENVAEVYLTAAKQNFKVVVISQAEKEIKFKVPNVKPGPYKLLVLMKSVEPLFIEEPVRLVVEE